MRIKNFAKFNEELMMDDTQFGFFSEIERGSLIRSNKKIIDDSYNDYMELSGTSKKNVQARHIARTAQGYIKNSGGKLEDWLDKFKDEKIVLDELNKIVK